MRDAARAWGIPHHGAFHVAYHDLLEICDGDQAAGHALRAFEMRTTYRINKLRRLHGIPPDQLPAEDDLWMPMSLRQLEALTCHVCSKSTYARVLLAETAEGQRSSLLERGFLRRRFVARPLSSKIIAMPQTTVFIDREGPFVVVEDETKGTYLGSDGKVYQAVKQGFAWIARQFLFCIEAVEAALARLRGEKPQKPLERWKAIVGRKGGAVESQETAKSTEKPRAPELNEDPGVIRGGNLERARITSFDSQHITEMASLSMLESMPEKEIDARQALPTKPDPAALRQAPWTASTVLGLSSAVLPVPDLDAILASGDEEALAQWYEQWEKPAERLMGFFAGMSPEEAWAASDRLIRYMATASPSWWWHDPQKPKKSCRSRNDPLTLQKIADNFAVVWADLGRKQWYPSETTLYDGSLESTDERPASGSTTISEEEVLTLEEEPAPKGSERQRPQRPQGLLEWEVAQLAQEIAGDYPGLARQLWSCSLSGDRFALRVALGPGEWMEFFGLIEYWDLDEGGKALLAKAAMIAEGKVGGGGIQGNEEQTEKS